MKPEKLYLDKLAPSSNPYKVKVWVKLKAKAQVSPKKKVLYQHLILEDEVGNTMKGTLFGNQIDEYENVLKKGGLYEIANAPLKPVDPKFMPKNAPTNVTCEMTFGGQASIQLLELDPNASSSSPNYSSIGSIPATSGSNELFDVLGIVLFVEETRTVTSQYGNPKSVREIVITDHSAKQPLIITAWGDLTGPDCNLLASWANEFLIVGFTSLQPSHHKGFSLATTMGTTFEHNPTGDKAQALRAWCATKQTSTFSLLSIVPFLIPLITHLLLSNEHKVSKNRTILEDWMGRVLTIRNPPSTRTIFLIRDVDQKKAGGAGAVWQEETFWLHVTALDPQRSDVTAYIGCNRCGKRTEVGLDSTYYCQFCSRDGCQATKRVTFRFNATDDSGTLKLTAYSKDCEALFKYPLDHLYDRLTNNSFDFKAFSEKIQDSPFYVQVGPTTALSRTGALSWCLRSLAWE